MRKLVVALLAGSALSFASAASAADAFMDQAAASYDWSGFYVGLQAGGGWANMRDNSAVPPVSYNLNGFMLGAHAGYNFQHGNVVFGLEADVNYNWNRAVLGGPGFFGSTPWDASVRGRLGYAIDRTLIYATGGIAFTNLGVDRAIAPVRVDLGYTGWTAGIGVEHAFTKNLTARIEYRYTDFGSATLPAPFVGTVGLTKSQALVGISYKF